MDPFIAGTLALGLLALLASVLLLAGFRFERFVGTRYLRRGSWSRAVRIGPFVALGVTLADFLVMLAARHHSRTAETVAVIIALVALLATILLVLLRFFSVFTTVSTVGVMLGVASLVVVLSVTSGFAREFQDKVQAVNAHLMVTAYGLERDVEEAAREARKVRAVLEGFPGLVRTSRFSFTAGEVMIGKIGANLKGVDVAEGVPELRRALVAGSVDDLGRPATCPGMDAAAPEELVGRLVLGADLARKLHKAVGDCVQVLVPFSGVIESTPSAYTFRVVGMTSFGFQEYDAHLGFIPLEDAERLGNARQSIFGVELRFSDAMLALRMEEEVENRLGPDRRIINWKTLNKNLFTALAMQKLIISLLLVLIIVVAAFNILASLMLVVLSKVREVAILAAMGARRGSLLRVFLVAGSIVGFVGTGLGIVFGLSLCGLAALYGYPLDPKVYLIAELPVEISAHEILLVAGATQIISLLATLYPARRASRQQVVDGLKYV
ncbi:MAG: ABC transporter permease [Deltaproteobacteria bacterium]|nr:ABC transporter permease [Deltaproteobacteria bacterium]